MRSSAETPEAYLAELPEDRRQALARLRALILENLPDGYVEAMNWGMIAYEVPLSVAPETYNGQPLMLAALASQKKHMALYLCGLDCIPGLRERFGQSYRDKGLKLDMGAACLRFRSLDAVDFDAVAAVIGAVPVTDFVAVSERR
jgi:hypothetical protein